MIRDARTVRRSCAALERAPARRRAAPAQIARPCARTRPGAHAARLRRGGERGAPGARFHTPASLRGIRAGPPRAALDPRGRRLPSAIPIRRRMAGAVPGTSPRFLPALRGAGTAAVTGGSTCGCGGARVAADLSCARRVIVAQECAAGRRESPRAASLHDMTVTRADVPPAAEVAAAIPRMEG